MLLYKRCGHSLAPALILVASLSLTPVVMQPSLGASSSETSSSASSTDGIYKEIQDLVKEYYPKARFSTSEKKLHFEEKVRNEVGYYSGHIELTPQAGGILGDLSLVSGDYEGADKDRLPSEVANGFNTVLVMAPYSKQQQSHLLSRLVFPRDLPNDFKDRFKQIVKSYTAGDSSEPSSSPATTVKPAAPTLSAATASSTPPPQQDQPATNATSTRTGEISNTTGESVKSSPAASASSAVTFGSAKLSRYSYPEGRFSVLLPGNPLMSYKNQAGIRMVDYSYPEVHGSFNVSYVIMPGQANPAAINLLFDKLTESFVKTLNGAKVKQFSTTLQGFPARQIDMGELKSKTGCVARLRMYSVRRFVYVIGLVGKKEWIDSPVANDFLGSFSFSPELTAQEKMQQDMREAEKRRQAFDEDFKRRQQQFNDRFQQSQSNSRKASERARADFQTNRIRN
jgi:hypothetical protein